MTAVHEDPEHGRRRRGRRGPEPSFTADDVFAAALRLVDAEGLDALTMRRLADCLGTGVMSLYRYVRTKEEIVAGVAALALRGLEQQRPLEGGWQDQVASFIRDFRNHLRSHPSLIELIVAGLAPGPALFPFRERALAVLREPGFGPEEASEAVATCLSYALGFAVAERAQPKWTPDDIAKLQGPEADRFPYLSEAVDYYQDHLSERAFEQGIEDLVEGLKRRLADREALGSRELTQD